jgi:hypothetical protein
MYGLNGEIQLNIKKTMDYKFLNKVVDQIVRETTIGYENDRIFTPFSPNSLSVSLLLSIVKDWNTSPLLHRLLRRHCKEVYGLNDDEVNYVWNEYKEIIIDKINNGL